MYNVNDDSEYTLFPVCHLLFINSFNQVPLFRLSLETRALTPIETKILV